MNSHRSNTYQRNAIALPSLQDPEIATARIAKTVTLDLNDADLLIYHHRKSVSAQDVSNRVDCHTPGRGTATGDMSQRYNISNDDAYDLLKENHQNKVRSTLGNPTVEHSLPAVRLQWPFVSP